MFVYIESGKNERRKREQYIYTRLSPNSFGTWYQHGTNICIIRRRSKKRRVARMHTKYIHKTCFEAVTGVGGAARENEKRPPGRTPLFIYKTPCRVVCGVIALSSAPLSPWEIGTVRAAVSFLSLEYALGGLAGVHVARSGI